MAPVERGEGDPPLRNRRRRGEPRRFLIKAAKEVFNEKGYQGASTREIAERAEVSETLMFRYFGTKAGLFREAMVQPFIAFVDRFVLTRDAEEIRRDDVENVSREFLAELYDIANAHRALGAILFTADVHSHSDLAASGVLDEVRDQLERLVQVGNAAMIERGVPIPRMDLTTRTTMAMVFGMATMDTVFFGKRRPSRAAIVEELTMAVLYGHARVSD
jgi:AcrR family transcriptional regulator